jgi:hypothetical protein
MQIRIVNRKERKVRKRNKFARSWMPLQDFRSGDDRPDKFQKHFFALFAPLADNTPTPNLLFCDLFTTIVQNLRSLRKFLGNRKLGFGYSSRQDAKSAKFGIIISLCGLCVFARDIPRFGRGFAALCPLWLILSFSSAQHFALSQVANRVRRQT